MMMARRSQGLSERHRKILEFLTRFQEENGYSPSIREIGDSINVKSTSLVDYYLTQLEQMGFISRDDRVSRSIRVLEPAERLLNRAVKAARQVGQQMQDVISIPILGRIVAGEPIPVFPSDFSSADYTVEIARSLLPARERPEELFALEVQGDSMIDAMVNDGDTVILRRAQEANNGEMVAVWLDDRDETTLKYFYKEKDRIRLQPANPTMGPIYVENPASLRIMGKVVMVIRQVKSVAA
ncbi:MAG: transcriptional repressor LexA [Bellilinea sp.]|jgi:repressor LexA|nr:transcriptional repressor LexA [Bellilinea sp.]